MVESRSNYFSIHSADFLTAALSERQLQMAEMVAAGLTRAEIADLLNISSRHAEAQIEKIKRTLGCHFVKSDYRIVFFLYLLKHGRIQSLPRDFLSANQAE